MVGQELPGCLILSDGTSVQSGHLVVTGVIQTHANAGLACVFSLLVARIPDYELHLDHSDF